MCASRNNATKHCLFRQFVHTQNVTNVTMSNMGLIQEITTNQQAAWHRSKTLRFIPTTKARVPDHVAYSKKYNINRFLHLYRIVQNRKKAYLSFTH